MTAIVEDGLLLEALPEPAAHGLRVEPAGPGKANDENEDVLAGTALEPTARTQVLRAAGVGTRARQARGVEKLWIGLALDDPDEVLRRHVGEELEAVGLQHGLGLGDDGPERDHGVDGVEEQLERHQGEVVRVRLDRTPLLLALEHALVAGDRRAHDALVERRLLLHLPDPLEDRLALEPTPLARGRGGGRTGESSREETGSSPSCSRRRRSDRPRRPSTEWRWELPIAIVLTIPTTWSPVTSANRWNRDARSSAGAQRRPSRDGSPRAARRSRGAVRACRSLASCVSPPGWRHGTAAPLARASAPVPTNQAYVCLDALAERDPCGASRARGAASRRAACAACRRACVASKTSSAPGCDDVAHRLRELADRQVLAGADVDVLGVVVVAHQEQAGVGEVVDVEELAARRARAPDRRPRRGRLASRRGTCGSAPAATCELVRSKLSFGP